VPVLHDRLEAGLVVRAWLASLARGRSLELALALALGYALFTVAESVASITTDLLAQHLGRAPGLYEDLEGGYPVDLFTAPLFFNFEIGGTTFFYGPVLSALISLGLVLLAGLYVVRRRDRELGACPHCASLIPHDSTHGAYCGSSLALSDDDRAAPVG
jgi:hypothetical protein